VICNTGVETVRGRWGDNDDDDQMIGDDEEKNTKLTKKAQ
jgi:hypothetical protein